MTEVMETKLTWTLKEDLPDVENSKRNLPQEQEEYLINAIGLTLYGALCEVERERTKSRDVEG